LRPTFDKKNLTIEVHVFDFNEDIYGEEISLYFIRKIREEIKFENADALTRQIRSDIETAKATLARHQGNYALSYTR